MTTDKLKKIIVEKAKKIIVECDSCGFAYIAGGIFLETGKSLQEQSDAWADDDPGKWVYYGEYPYWLTTDNGTLPIGITGADDPDLLNAMGDYPDLLNTIIF